MNSATSLQVGQPDTSSLKFKILNGVHETFVRTLEASLSTFLQSEIKMNVGETALVTLGDFQKSLPTPTCLIVMKLHPRADTMMLHFDSATVFMLLEYLLGGKGAATPPAARELTEIEWSLLEEVVRVVVRPLGEAWRVFHETEFEVETLESDPTMMTCAEPARQMMRIVFTMQVNEQAGQFVIAVPQAFFEEPAPVELSQVTAGGPSPADFERNLALLEDSAVDLEIRLQGPTLEFEDLMDLKAGQVLTFDYPLRKTLQASVNGAVTIEGYVVSSGRKRAFQVEEPL